MCSGWTSRVAEIPKTSFLLMISIVHKLSNSSKAGLNKYQFMNIFNYIAILRVRDPRLKSNLIAQFSSLSGTPEMQGDERTDWRIARVDDFLKLG